MIASKFVALQMNTLTLLTCCHTGSSGTPASSSPPAGPAVTQAALACSVGIAALVAFNAGLFAAAVYGKSAAVINMAFNAAAVKW